MLDRCRELIEKAAGRKLTAPEVRDIDDTFKKELKNLASEDLEKFRGMSQDERYAEAAKRAAEALVAKAMKDKQRLVQTLAAHDKLERYIEEAQQRGLDDFDALRRYIATDVDGKSGVTSLEAEIKATKADYMRQMIDVWEATDPRIFGLFEDKEGTTALLYEIKGQDSSQGVTIDGKRVQIDPAKAQAAKKAAKVWKEQTDAIKAEFNANGGKVGTLEDWGLPQHHSAGKVLKAGQDDWVSKTFQKLDVSKYVKEDGTLMTEQEIINLLKGAYESIVSGGANKMTPGRPMIGGSRSNRFREERVLHFKSADDYINYQKEFGDKSLYGVLTGHMASISKEIAIAKKLGPNADQTFKYFIDRAYQKQAVQQGEGVALKDRVKTQNLFDFVAGRREPVASQRVAAGFDSLRSWLVASRLGSLLPSMLPDQATMYLTAKVNRLRGTDLFSNQLKMMNPKNVEQRRMANRAGLALNALIGELNRFGTDGLGRSFADKMASSVMRVQGAEAFQAANQAAFGVTMYSAIGHNVSTHESLSSMHPMDRRILESYGVTEDDFRIWKMAETEDWGAGAETTLTPDAIYSIPDEKLAKLGDPETLRRDAARKLLATVLEETDVAILQPGAREKAAMQNFVGKTMRGTWGGELWRSVLLFKTFPVAMLMRHWRRGMTLPTRGGKAAYIAGLVATTSILGGLAVQINQLLAGKDPKDMTDWRFGVEAALKGGSLGVYGDFLFSQTNSYNKSLLGVASGPMIGAFEDVANLTQGNIMQYMKGEKTDFGAELVRSVKSYTPFANLWYTKAAIDRLVWNQLAEMASPGSMRRVEQRAKKDFNQQYYWHLTDTTPKRAPDIERALGK